MLASFFNIQFYPILFCPAFLCVAAVYTAIRAFTPPGSTDTLAGDTMYRAQFKVKQLAVRNIHCTDIIFTCAFTDNFHS